MIEINADFHIHSRYSSGVSQKMNFDILDHYAEKKGIDLLGTGDCLHPKWRKKIKSLDKKKESIFSHENTDYILCGEVETADRVHHLLIFPSLSKVEEMYERLQRFSSNIDPEGRPKLKLSGEELALIAKESSCLFGPSHAFTPYTGLYGEYDSIDEAYGKFSNDISFLELGLSADSNYANGISELDDISYLSNSDAHSPFPHRLAREFNMMELEELSFEAIKRVFEGKKGKIVKNVGLPTEMGKYNESACDNCFNHYELQEAKKRDWRCSCGSPIKKGVKDRVEELSDTKVENKRQSSKYLSLIPLKEIIAVYLDISDPTHEEVMEIWKKLIENLGEESKILTRAPVEKIEKIAGEEIGDIIRDFRQGNVEFEPGGGGRYGGILSEDKYKRGQSQKTLSDF